MKKYLFLLLILLTACTDNDKKPNNSLDLTKHPEEKLLQDFDLLVHALKEAHTGLYWYSTKEEFESFAAQQRQKITDSLSSLEFYSIAAPVVAFTKEDHCDIRLDEETEKALTANGAFMPLTVTWLQGKVYILNNPAEGIPIRGHELLEINGQDIESVYNHIYTTFASDGFVKTSKYRYLDTQSLATEYVKAIGQRQTYTIVALNPKTGKTATYNLAAVNRQKLHDITRILFEEGLLKFPDEPARLEFTQNSTAILTINTFGNSDYKEKGMNFKAFIENSFDTISTLKIKNLVLDIRENGGGTEGNEDYLFSYLAGKPYNKYKYVQLSALAYSFYQYTDYSDEKDYKDLETDLEKEHYRAASGKLIRKSGIEPPAPLQQQPFTGNIYVLTSGWTYSGGAEFCSLMKEHTNAIFIGEETGGGFYGNTSGYMLELTLPNTGLTIDIPLLKFVLDVSDKMPFGRGLIPDHDISPTIDDFLKGRDTQMEFVEKLLQK